jgi:biopolymer transport protein ExbD
MLFSLRIGSVCFFSLAPAGRSYQAIKVAPPQAVMNKRFVVTDDKNTIRIWLDRSKRIVIDSSLVNVYNFENALLKYDQHNRYKKAFFHADKECTMVLITPIIMELRKSGYNEIIFVTYGSIIGIW